MSAPTWVLDTNVVVLEVALETAERTLVTGNLRHFPISVRGAVTVLSPREAWEQLNRGG